MAVKMVCAFSLDVLLMMSNYGWLNIIYKNITHEVCVKPGKKTLVKLTISMRPSRITAAFVLSPYLIPSVKPAPSATTFYKQHIKMLHSHPCYNHTCLLQLHSSDILTLHLLHQADFDTLVIDHSQSLDYVYETVFLLNFVTLPIPSASSAEC